MGRFYQEVEAIEELPEYDAKKDASERLEHAKFENSQALMQDPSFINDARIAYKMDNGKDFEGTDGELGQYGYNLVQSSKWNMSFIAGDAVGAAELYTRLQSATPEEREAVRRLRAKFENTDSSLSDVGRALVYMGLDPLNYVGGILLKGATLKTGVSKLIGKSAADKVAMMGASTAGKKAVRDGAIAGGAWTAGDSALQQNIDITTDEQQDFSYGELGQDAAVGAIGGGALGAVVHNAPAVVGKLASGLSRKFGRSEKEVEALQGVTPNEIQDKIDEALPENEAEAVRGFIKDNNDLVAESELNTAKRIASIEDEMSKISEMELSASERNRAIKALEEDIAYAKLDEAAKLEKAQDELMAYREYEAQKLDSVMFGNQIHENSLNNGTK